MNKPKNISKKNYIILGIICVVTIVLTLYINAWVKTYKENKISVSPLSGVVEEVNINEIDLAFSEMNEVILYVGYTNDKTIYDMEKKLLKYIKKLDIVDNFIYVNITDYKDNDEYIEILKKSFGEVKDEIKKAPMIIYVKNGKAEKVVNSKNKRISTYDISDLNETYELSK